ncbi:MAG: NAD-dependent epimerase/dehydratase family protein [Proteobacteria bacterium]|nr:NAD-dependent epimerase/dehydratase family protein [Pseudomonadota bacterium]MBU1739810.1 NAD-dependent epimerase/dehydratase family protein [Pseudomonadota bacterium]
MSDQLVYFISTTHNYHVFDDIHKDINTNLTVLVDVLKNLTPGKSVLNFISSWFVYGDTELPATEESVCNPKGFYSITKRAAEELLVSYCQTFGVDYRILRLGNVYGRGDAGVSKQKNALQFLIDKLVKGEPVDLYHGGHFYRDYLHVEDVADAIDLVVAKGELNRIYNIGSGEKILFKDVIDLVRECTGSSSEVNVIEPPEFHRVVQVKDFYMNVDRLKALGFNQRITFAEGIKELCQ